MGRCVGGGRREIGNVWLVGHSCGAFIISHILLGLPHIPIRPDTDSSSTASSSSSSLNPTNSITATDRTELVALLAKVKGYGFLDGIYDLSGLIAEYPGYDFFVHKAFGVTEGWAEASVSTLDQQGVEKQLETLDGGAKDLKGKKLLVAHSKEDELLTERQSRLWERWLKDVVWIPSRSADGPGLWYDDTTLQGTHDGCLQHEGLGKLLASLVAT